MQTIIVLLNPGMLENADLDLRYRIPDRIEEVSNSLIQSNGYDYIDTEDGEPGLSQTARSVVKQTGCFVGRSRAAVSGGRCVLSPPDCFVA